MKVLQINNVHYRRGGADAVYLNTAELLLQHGNEVVFFNMLKNGNLPCKDEKYWVSSLDSRPQGIKSKLIELRNFFDNPEAARKIEELIIAEKPDIAHIHLFWGMGISPSITKVLKKYHIPLVHTAHDYHLICPVALLMDSKGQVCEACKGKHFIKAMLKGCSHNGRVATCIKAAEQYYHNMKYNPVDVLQGIIYVSYFSQNKHLEYMPSLAKVKSTVLYNFNSIGEEREDYSGKYYLYYGRLAQEKGLFTLVEAFRTNPALQLKIVGTGPLEDAICQQLPSNVEMLGPKYGEELFELVKGAKFVCVSSECYENNPLTIVESYSWGVPVIGSRLGGITEIIRDGETGFLFEHKNENELSNCLSKAEALSESKYVAMCKAAYHFAQDNFSSERHYERLMAFYKDVILSNKH